MQVFAKRAGLLGGIDEAIAVLCLCSGRPDGESWLPGWDELEVRALYEGDEVEPWETVLTIAGDYPLFAHLETAGPDRRRLGGPRRRGDRRLHRGPGELVGRSRHRPIPHSLIAAYGGDTVAAARAYADRYVSEPDAEELREVTPRLASKVRDALDAAGHERVKIVASGGFDAEKIERFEERGAPVDSYGVGSALLGGSFDFTADVVELDGRPCAKAGRELRPNPRLRPVQ
jgi:nicotinate phosphoribosyltransferase